MNNILQHFNDEEKLFVKKILEIKEKISQGIPCITTEFLTMREQMIVQQIVGDELCVKLWGGYEQAERKMAFISNDINEASDMKEITKLFIKYNKKFGEIRHRATLGAVLSLGIERKFIGDILITDRKSYIIVSTQIAPFICENLEKIGRTNVELLPTEDEMPKVEENYVERTLFVKSLRIDSLLAFCLKISREDAQKHIEGKQVQINWQVLDNPANDFAETDVISIRKFGRIYIDDIQSIKRDEKFKIVVRQLT